MKMKAIGHLVKTNPNKPKFNVVFKSASVCDVMYVTTQFSIFMLNKPGGLAHVLGEFAYISFPEKIELGKWIRKIVWAA